MNLQTVITNLKNTIAGKEKYLTEQRSALALSHLGPAPIVGAELAVVATIQFLEINIAELKRILKDVEQCIPKEPEFDESDSEEVRNLIRMGR